MIQLQLAVSTNDIEAICDIGALSQLSPEFESTLEEMLDSFCRAANYGMFAGLHYQPERSRFIRKKSPVSIQKARCHWQYETQFIDIGAFRVLMNMFVFLGSELGYDLTIIVTGALSHSRLIFDSENVSQLPYPGTSAEMSFAVEDKLKEPTDREVIVRVDCKNKLTESEVNNFYDIFVVWHEILKSGGFHGPAGAERLRTVQPFIEHYLVSPYLVEFVIYENIGSIESYSALLNALNKIHRTKINIVGVELE